VPDLNELMKGQVCMVTGATSGIGEVTARELAARGAEVVVVSRNAQKCQNTVSQIRKQTGNPAVDYMVADLSSQSQIRRLVQEFRPRFPRLDVLVNNAGAFFLRRRESEDGIEKTWALDHLNYFLLTNLLLDVIEDSAPARIVNVASGSHRRADMHFDDLGLKNGYSGMRAYGQAKLGNILFTYELARRLEGSGVTVNAVHPGFVATNIGSDNGWLVNQVMKVVHLFGRSPKQGAETVVYLASSPEVEGVSGKYFFDKQPIETSAISYDRKTAQRLWKVSAQMTGLDVSQE
jgi:NAD(P)-dependent dehydrogenase (short-subunit alcohol dehydrogenase family)